MRKKISTITLGIFLIIIGIITLGNLFDVWNLDIFFNGFWTLFIIVPAFIDIINNKPNTFNCILLSIGVILLLNEQNILDKDIIWKLIFAVALIEIGISIIFKKSNISESDKNNNIKTDNTDKFIPKTSAIFTGSDADYTNFAFHGTKLTVLFGGSKLHLEKSQITENCEITGQIIFGGADIYLPSNVKVIITGTSIFGGYDNHFISSTAPDAPTVYINITSVFGGFDVK